MFVNVKFLGCSSLGAAVAVTLSGCAQTTQLQGADRVLWERCNSENWFPSLAEAPILRGQACEERVAALRGRPPPPRPSSIMDINIPSAQANTQTVGRPIVTVPTGGPAGRLSQQQIAACSDEIKKKQTESQSWSGDVNAVASRLGQYQKDLFEGRCAGHPEAQTYIAGANKMLGYGGNATGRGTAGGSQSNIEIQAAPQCAKYYIVSEAMETRTSDKMFSFGIQNICNFPVYIHWNGYFNDVETQSINYSVQLRKGTSSRPIFGPGEKIEAIPFRIASQRRFHVKIHSVCPTEPEATRLTGKRIASVGQAYSRGMCVAQILDSTGVGTAQ